MTNIAKTVGGTQLFITIIARTAGGTYSSLLSQFLAGLQKALKHYNKYGQNCRRHSIIVTITARTAGGGIQLIVTITARATEAFS